MVFTVLRSNDHIITGHSIPMKHQYHKIVLVTVSLIALLGLSILTIDFDQFGAIPSGQDLTRVRKSENYDLQQDMFVNQEKGLMARMREEGSFWSNPQKNLKNNFFLTSNQTRPDQPLPEDNSAVPPNFNATLDTIKFAWLGHSTILLSMQGKTILIDPVFQSSAAPVSWMIKRFQPTVLDINALPEIDYILISHDHYDHLEMATIQYFRDADIKFIVPLGVSSHLKKWGVLPDKIVELDWWQTTRIGELEFICTPAKHYSGRKGMTEIQKSLWASWVVKSDDKSVYFSGDSGYGDHYKKIGDRHGPIDLVFMDSGQYNMRWQGVHNMPKQAVKAFRDIKGKHLVPVHWGMFSLAMHDWFEPPAEIYKMAIAENLSVILPVLGQRVDLKNLPLLEKWWESDLQK